MSTPFCVSGRAAMKMTSRTRSTSISGVTFMSALTFGASPRMTVSAPWCAWAAMLFASPGRLLASDRFPFGDETDIFDLCLAQRVERRHHAAVRRVLIGLEIHDLFFLVLERV